MVIEIEHETITAIQRLIDAGLSAKVTISPPKVETFKSDNPVVSVTTGGATDIYELIAKIESILNQFFTNQKSNL
jgi:predicted metalloenzyme YecM